MTSGSPRSSTPAPARTRNAPRSLGELRLFGLPVWLYLLVLTVVSANLLAGWTAPATIELMRSRSDFANEVRRLDEELLPYWRAAAYSINLMIGLVYLWPLVAFFRPGRPPGPAPLVVQRRATSAPVVIPALGFWFWVLAAIFFPLATLYRFGRWSPELMSQHILSTLVNGFLAATVSYLLADWLFRRTVIPYVFPAGRLATVPGSLAPRVQARLLIFLFAVAFIPLFTLLGLVRAVAVHVASGAKAADEAVAALATTSTKIFFVYVVLGIALTLLLARSLTRPLGAMAAALGRVQKGDLDVHVEVDSSDEVGALEDGVNAMVHALRDRERILQTFGRVVEPSIRDRLLAGDIGAGGELRTASVLFCDLRGFTALAERASPAEVVATLNEFFTVLTGWVRECGGFVDKFIGDAMLVVFGLFDEDGAGDGGGAASGSLSRAETAVTRAGAGGKGAAAAIRCAVGMQDRLAELNTRRATAGKPALAVSIGIHTGEVLAGTIGAADRHEYTVIGDTVNVAARLQQACKEEGCALLVSERSYELARANGFTGALTARESVALRGRSEPVNVFGVP